MNALQGLPAHLRGLLRDTTIEEIREGMSGTTVFHLDRRDQPDWYLKIAVRGSEQDLAAELSRLLWLQGRLPVPEVVYWGEDDERQFLLIGAVPGLALYDESLRDQLPALMRLYAEGLRQVHGVAVETCPFDMRLDVKIAQASRRVQDGAVDLTNVEKERIGRGAQSLFRELRATRPADEDLVFTHGDYCTPNVLVDPGTLELSGFIDWGRAGVADRYQDLALAARSIEYNFGAEWVKPFYEAYGIRVVDNVKEQFYRLADEFF